MWTVFDKAWFERHQRILLWLLNTGIIGRWFKWVLCICKHDLGYRRRIVKILPNCYVVPGDVEGTLAADFRTHWKYAKRLYYAFKPLWWALHYWDCLVDTWLPKLSFGFAVLTVFPDPDPGVTTCDGYVIRHLVSESWATIIAGAGTGQSSSNVQLPLIIQSTSSSNLWAQLNRFIFLFDTSIIGRGAGVVLSATLSLWGDSKIDLLSITPSINIYTASPAGNTSLVNADFTSLGSTAFSTTIPYASWSSSGTSYNDFILNASGLAAVDTGGISKFGARNANYDVAASPPTWASNSQSYLQTLSADQSGLGNDPKLVVTYATHRIPPPISAVAAPSTGDGMSVSN